MALQQADISSGLAELSKLSDEELKELVNSNSDEKFDELVKQSDRVKSLEGEREILMASVRSLAEFNLAKQSDYEAERSKLLSFVGDCNKIKEEIQEKATKLLELSRKTSLESTLAVVLAAASNAEEDSENFAKNFLAGDIDYDAFFHDYCDKRKLAHLRRVKADKLRQETNESWTANSEGIIHDFGGSFYMAVDNMTFGRPTKFTRLDPRKALDADWDNAIQASATRFCERHHNIVTNNCHDHVADTLNEMRYNGRSNWSQLDVWWLITVHSQYVGLGGFLKQWGLFLLLLLILVIFFVFI